MIHAIPQDTKKKTRESPQNISEPRKTDEDINESLEKFRLLFENSVDAIFVADAETKMLTDCNKSAEKLVGRSKAEILTMSADALHPKDKVKETMEAFKRQAEGKIEYVGTEVLTKGGERVPVEINSSPFVFEGKTYLLGIFRDVSERKKTEDALQKSLTLYRGLIETTDTGFVILDQEGKVLDANREYVRLSGHEDISQIRGRSVVEWTADYEKEKNAEAVGKCFREGQIRNLEIDYVDAQGKITPIEINATVIKVDGTPQILTLCRDITERKKAEDALRTSEDKYRTLIENIPQKIFMKDRNSVYVSCNESYARDLKIKPDAITGKTDYEFYPKELAEKYRNDDKRVMELGKTEDIEEKYIQDGQEKFVHTTKIPLKDEQGNVVGILGIFWDITERKQAEEQLKLKTAILEAESETSVDGIYILDDSGKCVSFNKRFGEIWGIPQEILDTKDNEKMFGYAIPKLINPEEFVTKGEYLSAHKDEKSKDEIRLKDGRFLESYSAPLISQDHVYWGRIWYFHDTTALKQAEIELRTEKAKLEKYFNVIGIIAMVLGAKGEILLLNKRGCEMLGYQPNEVIGKNWITDFLSKDKKARPGNFLGGLLKDGTDSVYFEHSVFTKDGKEKNITWGSIPIRDEAGNIQAFLCAGEDVTILRQAEVTITQLKEFDRLKDEFLNIAAHELKTPLTSIVGLSEIIKTQKTCLPSQMAEYPDIIYSEGQRLSRVVRRILTITRYESGKEVIHPEPIALTAFISSLLPGLSILTKDKKVTIATNLKEESLQIESDKEMISEVIINFVDNSIKYGPENQTITVSAYGIDSGIDKGMVRIEVADQGPGIPPDSVNKLFNKFSQLEPSLSRSQEGTGLGLYICKLIVEKLGGRIGVESEVGKGSKFFFNLPLTCPSA